MNKIQEELVINNDKIVHYFVRKIKLRDMRNYEYDDLVQVGRIGLIKAAETFNGSVKFVTYASRCITNEIFMFLRKANKNSACLYLEEPVLVDMDGGEVTLGEVIEAPNSDFIKTVANLYEIEKVFNVVLNIFSNRNALIWLYLALGINQEKVAEKFGVTQSCISRTRSKMCTKTKLLCSENSTAKKFYCVKLSTTTSSISFSLLDSSKADMLVSKLIKKLKSISKKCCVVKNADKIIVFFSDIEIVLPVIATVVSIIYENEINLTNLDKN